MSGELTIGKRYAKALFELAKEKDQLDQVEAELKAVIQMFADRKTSDFFLHPSISVQQKLEVLNKALSGKISDTLLDTLQLLVERRRESAIGAVSSMYTKLVDAYRGRATAIVYTPIPLSEQEHRQVAEFFSKETGKEIRVINEINKELLGGMQVRIGDRLYDSSLSSKLAEMKKILA